MLLRAIKYDLKAGILRKWPLYLLFGIIMGAFAEKTYRWMNAFQVKGSPLDVLLFLFMGKREFRRDELEGFEFPFTFMAIMTLVFFLFVYYVYKEWKERASLMLPRFQDKRIWWISKCIMNVIHVFILMVVGLLFVSLVARLQGSNGFAYHSQVFDLLEWQVLQVNQIWIYLGICMPVTVFALTQLELYLQLICSPVVGYVIILGLLLISTFYYSKWIPGDYLILNRTALMREGGITPLQILVVDGIIILVTLILGLWTMRKKECL